MNLKANSNWISDSPDQINRNIVYDIVCDIACDMKTRTYDVLPTTYDVAYDCNIRHRMWNMHLESCTPGQDWAKWYVLVCTSTYQYNTVHVSTRIPNLYIPVCTSTYQYVLLRSQVVF